MSTSARRRCTGGLVGVALLAGLAGPVVAAPAASASGPAGTPASCSTAWR